MPARKRQTAPGGKARRKATMGAPAPLSACVQWLQRYIKPGESPVPSAEELSRRHESRRRALEEAWKGYDKGVRAGESEKRLQARRDAINNALLLLRIGAGK